MLLFALLPLQHCYCNITICKVTIAKLPLQHYYCYNTITTLPLQSYHCKVTIAKLPLQYYHCNITIAKLALQHYYIATMPLQQYHYYITIPMLQLQPLQIKMRDRSNSWKYLICNFSKFYVEWFAAPTFESHIENLTCYVKHFFSHAECYHQLLRFFIIIFRRTDFHKDRLFHVFY